MAVLVYIVNITAYTGRIAVRDVACRLMRKDCELDSPAQRPSRLASPSSRHVESKSTARRCSLTVSSHNFVYRSR
jgi:hypothetical protein